MIQIVCQMPRTPSASIVLIFEKRPGVECGDYLSYSWSGDKKRFINSRLYSFFLILEILSSRSPKSQS